MSFEIFGLSWKCPVVIINISAIIFDTAYEIVAICVNNLYPSISIYYRLPLGGIAMAGISLYCISESDSMIGLTIGYGMAAFNLLCALGFLVVGAAYVMGPNSGLWQLVVAT